MSSPSGSTISIVPRPSKLKDSCDSCAQAKVKCSRVRPTCQRCARNGLICHYSMARRGKATAAAAAAAAATATASAVPPPTAGPPTSQGTKRQRHNVVDSPNDFWSHADLDLIDGDFGLSTDFMTSPIFEATRLPRVPREIHDTSPEPGLDFSLLSKLGHDESDLRFQSDNVIPPFPTTTPPATDPELLDPPFDAAKWRPDLPLETANIRLVLSTLASLHLTSPTLAPGIDTILKTNNTAIANISGLLNSPSPLDTANATLLALICCNSITDTYQQISLGLRTLANADEEQNGGDDQKKDCFATAMAFNMPIAVGAFMLDNSTKKKIILSVLLAELTKVGKIVGRIVTCDKVGVAPPSRCFDGSREMVSTLKSLLEEKLRATIRAVKAGMAETDVT